MKPGSGWIYVFWGVLSDESSNGVPKQRESVFSHFGAQAFSWLWSVKKCALARRFWNSGVGVDAVACNLAPMPERVMR